MDLPELRELVGALDDAVMAIDSGGRIVAWNAAAQRLLGYPEKEALGRSCWDVLRGRDLFGNDYCSRHCPLLAASREGKPIQPFELWVLTNGGALKRIRSASVSIRAGSGGTAWGIHHFVESPFGIGGNGNGAADCPGAPGGCALVFGEKSRGAEDAPLARFRQLGPREVAVLRGLAEGLGTLQLAERLAISETTVRKHVQAVLRKLGVHGRLAAVIYAQEHGLL